MPRTDSYAAARRRAVAKYRFYVHAGIYAAVMLFLIMVNLFTSAQVLWVVWPILGWGIAVALHGGFVYLQADREQVLDAMTERELQRSSPDRTGRGQDRT